ncbi:MAG TPA: 50S ribosomal protein L11 methyltransferase [Patescibacteria group bacterium]|nr:50S ribosomal protein L11 methyltransferase [Patescibacteria group bacterium]
MLLFVIVVVTLCLLFFLLSMVWPPDSPWSPWWRTNAKVAKAIVELAKITSDDVVYDLGCGDGTALITAATMVGARGVGIEIDPSRAWIAKIRIWLHGLRHHLKIKRNDLFKENISEATVVVVYLIPKALKRLEHKFYQELKPGTRIISFVYPIDYLKPDKIDAKNNLLLYTLSHPNSEKKRSR